MKEADKIIRKDNKNKMDCYIKMLETNECKIYTSKYDIISLNTCVICLEAIPHNDFFQTECEHIFHYSCIDNWLKNKNSCPCCRHILNDNEENREELHNIIS